MKNNGENTWMSPATFKSSCQLDVQYFPFDKQKCNMSFRSLTSDRRMLDITTMEIKSDDPQKGTWGVNWVPMIEVVVLVDLYI